MTGGGVKNLHEIDRFRRKDADVVRYYGGIGDETCGAFEVPYPRTGVRLRVIASSDLGWDHVSVSLPNRCPNWLEMDFIKRTFFKPDEVVMQLHVADADHISVCHNCLHLWRPQSETIPLPPKVMVG